MGTVPSEMAPISTHTWSGQLAWLPYLVLAGAAAGLFTGLCAQLLVQRLGDGPGGV